MKDLIELFFVFAKIGLFTFGGGYAMLPMLQKEIVEKHKWAKEDEIMDYFAIGQVTPGIIAVNTATFVGHKTKGLIGVNSLFGNHRILHGVIRPKQQTVSVNNYYYGNCCIFEKLCEL